MAAVASEKSAESPVPSENHPQSGHELLDKIDNALDTFTLFPKLPIEIRFKIWKYSFPRGREVNFADELIFKAMSAEARGAFVQFEDSNPPPATLWINKESRQETLKHYYAVFRGDRSSIAGEKKRIEKPFCYNPKLDTAWINPVALQANYSDEWFSYLASKAPEVFSWTKVLEVRKWFWCWPSPVVMNNFPGDNNLLSYISLERGNDDIGKRLKPLLRFSSLEMLKLIPPAEFREQIELSDRYQTKYRGGRSSSFSTIMRTILREGFHIWWLCSKGKLRLK
jgi:hypothetical protein